ncbi:MAG: hypothetical protein BGO49_19660 [Planctomycetales bacterium 71-10]|nr:MAG: hypothetical protein BGO49_19660 [Planctomycetales bacterium 71-10]
MARSRSASFSNRATSSAPRLFLMESSWAHSTRGLPFQGTNFRGAAHFGREFIGRCVALLGESCRRKATAATLKYPQVRLRDAIDHAEGVPAKR